MESYNQMGEEDSSGNFPVPYLTSSLIAPPHHHMINMSHLVHLQSAPVHTDFFQSSGESYQHHHHTTTAVKNEARFHNYPLMLRTTLEEEKDKNTSKSNNNISNSEEEAMKAKIIAHPHYSNLLKAYMDCQKVGAPPEVSARLTEYETRQPAAGRSNTSKDPELDQFMEAYYDMLVKYREELSRPVEEAMEFMRRIESQLNLLTNGRARFNFTSDERSEGIGNSEAENSGGEREIDRRGEDRELKKQLLKKYSGYLSSLKQELSKKKKKGKLPKEARQKLLSWWEFHYKWPYPSESEKVALAEATGLDQKQINNWFINQRKRHWKPSEDMQFMVKELHHPHPLYTVDTFAP